MSFQLDSIADAISDLRAGKVVIVVDDEDRENEGDFLVAAELATPEVINFFSTHARGLICVPLTEKRCDKLRLDMMVGNNTDPSGTAFTVSVDLLGDGVTTGISAKDRSKTVIALVDEKRKAEDFSKPGHIFPLRAKEGGVLRRPGHTEAAIDLVRLAGLKPAGVIVEIMNEDGSMARMDELGEIAKKFDLKIISIEDLIAYRLRNDSLIEKMLEMPLETKFGEYKLVLFNQKTNSQVHFALVKGDWDEDEPVPVRVQSSNSYINLLFAILNNQQMDLPNVSRLIEQEKKGAIIFINNLVNAEVVSAKLNEYKSLLAGEAKSIKMDQKDYGIGAQIIKDLGIKKIKLISNSPKLPKLISGYGLEIVETLPYR